MPATNYTFIPPSAAQFVQISDGPIVGGVQTATISSPASPPGFEQVSYGNKTNVTINATGGSGDYGLTLDNSTTAAGQTTLTVTMGNGDETVDVQATPGGVNTSITTGSGNDFVTVVGAGLPTGIAGTSLAVNGGTGVNTLRVDGNSPGMSVDLSHPGVVYFTSPGGESSFTYLNFTTLQDLEANNPPTIGTAAGISAPQGQPLTDVVVGSFSDPDLIENATSYSATIDWGDSTGATSGTDRRRARNAGRVHHQRLAHLHRQRALSDHSHRDRPGRDLPHQRGLDPV